MNTTIRFAAGFGDGAADEAAGLPLPFKPVEHSDRIFVLGYFAGREDFRKFGHRPGAAAEVWDLYTGPEIVDRLHTFTVVTTGDPGELELVDASIAEDQLGALLHVEDIAEEHIGDGVVYARNQDGVMVAVMLDMDGQTPIVREIEITPDGVVYLTPGDGLDDNAGMKP